ncbi:GntR family transcriptional regulator [Pseudoroseicyclus tamaricis]|uniref:GntR family transcriptional regulator n=1 Tax=Pseudoroseicyclus tamaricis TaxID=2705421 RepID=A0A6B2JS16_9RHOB|nr:GntR family transcriptional regulator [Pseudoroseicyclus tamaricis]NDU99368.1 GntR family transcriptional regulator [Pseudoroseicyclus tamaricis]
MKEQGLRQPTSLQRTGAGSITSQVHNLLMERILSMELKPFDEVSEARLASELGVSRTPVREALARLSRLNLVDVYPQRGTFIAPISIQRVAKARFIRESLERPLSRLAAEKITPDMVQSLAREIALQKTFASLDDHASFLKSDDTFHVLIARAAGMHDIWDDLGEIRIHMDRIRRLSLLGKARMNAITAEHEGIFEAIRDGSPGRAEDCTRQHLLSVFTDLDAIRAEHPEYFHDSLASARA